MGSLTFQVQFLLWCVKCHIVQPDTSIKVCRCFLKVGTVTPLPSLHHPTAPPTFMCVPLLYTFVKKPHRNVCVFNARVVIATGNVYLKTCNKSRHVSSGKPYVTTTQMHTLCIRTSVHASQACTIRTHTHTHKQCPQIDTDTFPLKVIAKCQETHRQIRI